MLTKYKDVKPEKGIKSSLFKKFFQRGAPKFGIFQAFFFFFFFGQNCSEKINEKEALGGSGGMLPQIIFENFHTAVAVLALFE